MFQDDMIFIVFMLIGMFFALIYLVMKHLQANKYYKLSVFLITNIIVIAFLCQSIAWAQGGVSPTIQQVSTAQTNLSNKNISLSLKTLPLVNEISVPENLGKIQQRFQGNKERIVIHIQDSHANYEAQKNYAGILQKLPPLDLMEGRNYWE